MQTVNLLTNIVEHHIILAYFFIFLGLILEGEFILIFTGILSHLGALNFWFALFFILLGGLSKTLIGYSLGEYLFKKFNHNRFFKYIEKVEEVVSIDRGWLEWLLGEKEKSDQIDEDWIYTLKHYLGK